MLFDAKANIQARNNSTGCVPLHDAGKCLIFVELIYIVSSSSIYSQSTAKHGNLDAVRELLALGAPHRPRSSYGELPIDFAKEGGFPEVEKYLGNVNGVQIMNHVLITDFFFLSPNRYLRTATTNGVQVSMVSRNAGPDGIKQNSEGTCHNLSQKCR